MITTGGGETRFGLGAGDGFLGTDSVASGALGLSCLAITGASMSTSGGLGTTRGAGTGRRAFTPALPAGGGVTAARLIGAGARADATDFAAAGVLLAGNSGFGKLVLFSAMTDSYNRT